MTVPSISLPLHYSPVNLPFNFQDLQCAVLTDHNFVLLLGVQIVSNQNVRCWEMWEIEAPLDAKCSEFLVFGTFAYRL
jgi:hypothetical protein